ncbi:hypothetical protein SAMN04488056_11153 [Cohaesibacter marisflavi]|uniref:Uncharacterized protein n=1 Tax=Cohaesibacter marisflavi TaxID=655353 RepID=A0A1I5JB48_9HYPH|nr:hypothetical protein [Cohaesibacter marisflavi]SFO69860.1 hypothetical protein SAMN04488056_11153 [Cohaesibacter marisflavi]
MPSKRQLKSGKWNIQIRSKGQPSLSKTFTTEKEADQWAERIEAQLKGKKGSLPTWREMGQLYCDVVLAGKPSRHLKIGRVDIIGFHSALDKPYDKITVADINIFKQDRSTKVGPTTVHDDLVFIR